MEQPLFYTGNLLLALPGMGDPRFENAVILMCAHDENGALGLNLSQEVEGASFHSILEQLDIDPGDQPDRRLLLGGPVEPERGFLLHSLDYEITPTLNIAGRWGLTNSPEILSDIAAGKGPEQWVMTLGYSGWGPGQLEEEMTRHGWFLGECDDDLLFATERPQRWTAAFSRAGVNPAQLSGHFGLA